MTQEQRTEIMHNYKMFVKILRNKPILFSQHTGSDGIFYYTIITKLKIGGIWVYNGLMYNKVHYKHFSQAMITYDEMDKIKDKAFMEED